MIICLDSVCNFYNGLIMYFMYVDESGDSGLINSPKQYFILTGMVVHETKWQETFEQLIDFRRRIKERFGVKLREELHAFELISKPKQLRRITKNNRLAIVRQFAIELGLMDTIQFINIVVDKANKPPDYDVFENAWKALIQRFENTLMHKNFLDYQHESEHGLIFPDRTDDKKLTKIIRKMRRYNPIPNVGDYGQYQNLKLARILEDPVFKDSQDSFFIQSTDLVAYLLQQKLQPSSYMKKKSGHLYFDRFLEPSLCKVASSYDPQGIVRL